MRAIRPYILVQTNPQSINIGQPISISARLYDRNTNQPVTVRNIYLNIISMKDGHTIWPMEIVRKDTWKFDILIGTDEMKEGHTYLIRVSNNRNLSPMGATEFKIVKDNQTPLLLFPIPLPVREPTDVKREIKELTFRTQLDHRVCKFCKPYADKVFLPTEEFPHIPIHWTCRCNFDITYSDSFEASFREIQEVYQTAIQARKINRILKAVKWIENI